MSYVHTYIVQLYGGRKYILASRLTYTSKKLAHTTSLYGHLELIFVLKCRFVEEACNSKKLRNVWVKDELAEVAAIKDTRKDWSQEIKTACRLGNLKALHLLQYQASIDIKYT